MPNAYLIASDFHFCKVQNNILNSINGLLDLAFKLNAKLFLNGDLFSFYYEQNGLVPESSIPMIESIKSAVDRGLSVTVLRGNRDFLMGDELMRRTGCHVIKKESLKLEEEKIIITHGDQFDPNKKYRFWRVILRSPFAFLLAKSVPSKILVGVVNWISGLSKDRRKMNGVAYKKQLPVNVKVPNDFLMIMGHYHQEVNCSNNGKGYIICPAFDESSKALKIESGKTEFIEVGK